MERERVERDDRCTTMALEDESSLALYYILGHQETDPCAVTHPLRLDICYQQYPGVYLDAQHALLTSPPFKIRHGPLLQTR